MRSLRRIDLALLALLVPIWALAVSLHAVRVLEGRVAWMPILARAGPEGVPRVEDLLAGAPPVRGDVRPGDVLLRAGDHELRGAGRLSFPVRAWQAVDAELRLPLRLRRDGVERDEQVALRPTPFPLRTLPLVVITGLLAAGVILRGRGTPAARAFGLAGLAHSLQWATFFGPVPWQTALSLALALGSATLVFALTLRALVLFPAAVAPRGLLARYGPWAFLLLGPATWSWLLGWPLPSAVGLRAIYVLNVALVLAALAVITRNYRRSDAAGRRQLKWVLFGFYAGLFPVALAAALAALDPSFTWLHEVASAATVLIPLGVFVAIVRDDFLDIDRLLTETASASLVAGALLVGLVQAIPAAARAVADRAGIDPTASQALLVAGLVAVAVPARRLLRPAFERVFDRERTAVERGLRGLRAQLDAVEDPGKLFTRLAEGLEDLLRPESCVVYARVGDSFGPVLASGASIPPAFDAEGPLATLLEEHAEPVDAARWRRWRRGGLLAGPGAAALESLQPEVIVPLSAGEGLAAFVCLGPRRSGEMVTRRELAWLAGLAERAARQLERYSAAERLERSRELSHRLARYVPGALQERLARGPDLEPREREVSVLFVDIRGYTAFAEGRSPEQIFATVNRYTEEVSRMVVDHGGAVVEFHGDGLMAVFGAPEPLPAKEAAAVGAARQIARAVPRLDLGGERLGVGVGVATGPAYVGSIQAVDRAIWGAIGNTTNLAARLQARTRELLAHVAIDEATYRAAGETAGGFVGQGSLEIRGRREPVGVWILPLA